MLLPNFWIYICWWKTGWVRLTLLHPSGCITFLGFMSLHLGDAFVSATLAGKNVLGVVCLCVCVSASSLRSICQHLSLIYWCVSARGCVILSSGCDCVRWCQRLWQVCRFRAAVLLTPWSRSAFSGLQAKPSPQSQRWNSSKPWVPFLRWRVHTWPSVSTGLQMRDQKCLAQHRPSEQSADLRHVSPSCPVDW